jgi:hypothetical protein
MIYFTSIFWCSDSIPRLLIFPPEFILDTLGIKRYEAPADIFGRLLDSAVLRWNRHAVLTTLFLLLPHFLTCFYNFSLKLSLWMFFSRREINSLTGKFINLINYEL